MPVMLFFYFNVLLALTALTLFTIVFVRLWFVSLLITIPLLIGFVWFILL